MGAHSLDSGIRLPGCHGLPRWQANGSNPCDRALYFPVVGRVPFCYRFHWSWLSRFCYALFQIFGQKVVVHEVAALP